ncbi:MAG: COG4705 family protein, partial [Ktedonobacteraceae bacterium]
MSKTLPQSQPAQIAKQAMRKVPEVTIYFWIIKLLSTAMGESTSDYLVFHINPYVAVVLGCIGLVVALALQLAVRRYIPWVYWLAVVMVAIFGTMAADVLHVVLGIPYVVSTAFFILALVIIFVAWYASERTLSIHSITTTRRELFYWATVMATFALGTAVGDLTAATLGLGYFSSGVLFAILFALPALAYWLFRLNAIFAFWFAYIMTRPLGASFADWF